MNQGDFNRDPEESDEVFGELADTMDLVDTMINMQLSGGELDRRREEIMNRVRGHKLADPEIRGGQANSPATPTTRHSTHDVFATESPGPLLTQRKQASAPTLEEARKEAWRIVSGATAAAGAMGWVPGSSVLLAGADVVTVKLVADAFGVTDYTVAQVVGAVGKGFVGKRIAHELLSLVPGPGWAIKGGVASGMAAASGAALIEYMESKSPYM